MSTDPALGEMRPFTVCPSLRRFQVHRDLAVLILVVVGFALPFLGQPFHMDDNFYLDMVRNPQGSTLYPYDRPYDFGGLHGEDVGSHSHPPFQTYFLGAVHHFVGDEEGREWVYHAVALIFPIIAVVSMYFLSARFVERPLWPSMALAVCPILQVMGHNLMADVPTLAFWLAAVACFLWASELNRKDLWVASVIFQSAAMFTSYQAVSLAPLLGFYQVRKRGRASGWIALLLPLLGMFAWQCMNYFHYRRMVLVDTLGYILSRNEVPLRALAVKALAILQYQGWLIVFPLFLLYVFARGLKGRLFAVAVLASGFVTQAAVPASYRLIDRVLFAVGLATGFFIVAHMGHFFVVAFRKNRTGPPGFGRVEAQFLALWFFGVTAYCLLVLAEGSARYILPLVPAFLILYFRRLEMAEVSEYRADTHPLLNSAMVASGSVVLTLAWGLFLAQADYEFASVYPRAAAAFSRMSAGLDSYFTGEWGFRYYFSRAGAKHLPMDETTVRGGSLIIQPRMAMPYDMPADLYSMTMPLASLSFDVRTPFRTMDWKTPAGFYSTGWGLLPFTLSNGSQEILDIRQVNFMIERLPWARIECAGPVLPWPGYVTLHERALAILAKPGTKISYPWTLRAPMELTLAIGPAVEAAAKPSDADLSFEIIFMDERGNVLAQYQKTLSPGKRTEDREWQRVRLALPASLAGKGSLSFDYRAQGDTATSGAFAEATLVPLHPHDAGPLR